MRLTDKQNKVIKILEWFAPCNCEWDNKIALPLLLRNTPECNFMKEQENGVNADEAYFLKTDKGIKVDCVNDLGRFLKLYWGHQRFSLTRKMWQESFTEGVLHPTDFSSDPDYIQNIAKECCLSVGRKWK